MNILFLNFHIIGLCNSSANSLFEIISFLKVLPEVDLSTIEAGFFYQRMYKTLNQFYANMNHISDI